MLNELQGIKKWMQLEETACRELLLQLEGFAGHAFSFKEMAECNLNGAGFYTGIYELDGEEFVLIPGNPEAEIGWRGPQADDIKVLDAIRRELEVAAPGQNFDPAEYMRELSSPPRRAGIGPALVERNVRRLGSWPEETANYEDVKTRLNQAGFALPTEDEWEYWCGQGTPRIFAPSFPEELLEDLCADRRYFWSCPELELPNGFGLRIAYDPYIYELVDAPCIVKGGDGGGASHGGYYILGVLPLSPHYRDESIHDMMADGDFDCDVYARRIVRIL